MKALPFAILNYYEVYTNYKTPRQWPLFTKGVAKTKENMNLLDLIYLNLIKDSMA